MLLGLVALVFLHLYGKTYTQNIRTKKEFAAFFSAFPFSECSHFQAVRRTPTDLRDENSLPKQVCTGSKIKRTAIPARQDGPISSQRRTVTATACSGPAHKKCKKMVTYAKRKQSVKYTN